MSRETELEVFFEIRKATAQLFPVLFAGFNEGGQFFELLASDRSLGVQGLQVKTQMAVNVLVIKTVGKFAELPLEAFVAGVVLT